MIQYFIETDGQTLDDQITLNKLTSIRIGKINKILTLKKPCDILPFKGHFPLVEENEYEFFLKQTLKSPYFDELDEKIKMKVMKAEKIIFFHNSFKKYLIEVEELGSKGFKLLSKESEQEVFYRWLFKNKLDVGILNIG